VLGVTVTEKLSVAEHVDDTVHVCYQRPAFTRHVRITSETGKEKGIRVWHAMSRTVDNIDSSFLYGFYLIALTVRE